MNDSHETSQLVNWNGISVSVALRQTECSRIRQLLDPNASRSCMAVSEKSKNNFWEALFLNPLNAKLNSICHLLALLGAHHIHHVSRLRVNINQLDALNFIISLFQASTCFEHMCPKHVEA